MSGSNLKIAANNTTLNPNETMKFTVVQKAGGTAKIVAAYSLTAANAVVTSNETSSRKPIAKTIPKLSKRSMTNLATPPRGRTFTSQMVFRASFNWAKTPEAPTSNVMKPTTIATTLVLPCGAVLTTIACTALAALGPM